MVAKIHWIAKGTLQPPPANALPFDERHLLHRDGYVKVIEDEQGTTIQWAMFASNWASLYFALEWVQRQPGPFFLRYYSAGWFSEKYEHASDASDRIAELIYKSDIHLSSTIYIRDASENRPDVPPILKDALNKHEADEAHSIDCLFDPASRRYRVHRVGEQSTIAKFYGMNPISYPCLTGHSYDQVVSRVYPEVSRTGEPHYDHIYASFATATNEVIWVPYQRVVLPLRIGKNKKGVRVISEMAKVDISPL